MFFLLQYMCLFLGLILAGICGLLSGTEQLSIPDPLRYMMFLFGCVLAFMGVFLVHMRAVKTGVSHFIAPGRPGDIKWFYVYRDGNIKITDSIRVVEGQLYSKELDAQISDTKAYKLFDHQVRFVPEGLGHAVDLDMCLYAAVLKTKWGLTNIREARRKLFNFLNITKPLKSQEMIVSGKELDREYPEIQKYEREMKRKTTGRNIIGSTER